MEYRPRARLRALLALGGFDALLCYVRFIFKHSHTKWDKIQFIQRKPNTYSNKTHTEHVRFFFFFGGGALEKQRL